jgi:hypothetical protein
MSYEQAIAEAYASADVNEIPVDTIEFRHPLFVDDNGNPTAIRLAVGYKDYVFTLEPNAPANGGQAVTFIGCPFEFTLPEVGDGATPELKISVDNVDRRMATYMEEAAPSLIPIQCTYRPYLESDPSGPQMDPPFTFTLTKVIVDVFKISGTATTNDVNNWGFPNRIYTPQEFPGLVR